MGSYTMFTTVGGACQILGMMVVYPLLHKKLDNTSLFKVALSLAMGGYALILIVCFLGFSSSLVLLCLCGALVFAANGILTVLTTVAFIFFVKKFTLTDSRVQEIADTLRSRKEQAGV